MMVVHRSLLWVVALALMPGAGLAQEPSPTGKALIGVWISRDCEAGSPSALMSTRRIFHFGHSTWKVEITFYSGAACAAPMFGIGVEGSYALQASPTGSPAPAFGTFFYSRKTAWALSADGAARLTAAHCGANGWQPGATQDISATGCLAFPPISSACLQEFDLVSGLGEELRFGARRPEMCREDGRPASLSLFPLIRLPPR